MCMCNKTLWNMNGKQQEQRTRTDEGDLKYFDLNHPVRT